MLQVDESNVEEKDIELVMQQANVSRSKVRSFLSTPTADNIGNDCIFYLPLNMKPHTFEMLGGDLRRDYHHSNVQNF